MEPPPPAKKKEKYVGGGKQNIAWGHLNFPFCPPPPGSFDIMSSRQVSLNSETESFFFVMNLLVSRRISRRMR